jgi:enamine deaminase RidA (YjgF/YER057c/UK114 family)
VSEMPRTTLSVPTTSAPNSSTCSTLYVAGQVPIDVNGEIVGADAATQARQVLSNLAAALEAASATFANVVKTTVYLTNRDDRGAVGEVRQAHFTAARPPTRWSSWPGWPIRATWLRSRRSRCFPICPTDDGDLLTWRDGTLNLQPNGCR